MKATVTGRRHVNRGVLSNDMKQERLPLAAKILAFACVAVTLFVVVVACWEYVVKPAVREAREELKSRTTAESIEILDAAHTLAELEEAVGRLGAVFTYADGSWVAIRYRDNHSSLRSFSTAVARDSHGSWYHSDYHFCGNLGGYMRTRQQLADAAEEQGSENSDLDVSINTPWGKVEALANCDDLDSARSVMTTYLDFEPIQKPEPRS